MPQQPPPSPTVGSFGGGSGLPFGAGAGGLGSPRTNGSMHGGVHGGSGYGGPASPGLLQGGLHGSHLGGGNGGGDDVTAMHRRVRSADFGTPPRRSGRNSGNSTGDALALG